MLAQLELLSPMLTDRLCVVWAMMSYLKRWLSVEMVCTEICRVIRRAYKTFCGQSGGRAGRCGLFCGNFFPIFSIPRKYNTNSVEDLGGARSPDSCKIRYTGI